MHVDESRLIRRAVKLYNRYRAPEATARLVTRKGDTFYIAFDGTYCETCGLYDWIDDMRYVMNELGLEAEIIKLNEPEGPAGSLRIAAFRVRKSSGPQPPQQ